jgi:hypothetical protein
MGNSDIGGHDPQPTEAEKERLREEGGSAKHTVETSKGPAAMSMKPISS